MLKQQKKIPSFLVIHRRIYSWKKALHIWFILCNEKRYVNAFPFSPYDSFVCGFLLIYHRENHRNNKHCAVGLKRRVKLFQA
jgi:hypothetical protein